MKAQLSIEFLISFSVYLALILILVLSLDSYRLSIGEKNQKLALHQEIENFARTYDFYCATGKHFSKSVEGSYLVKDGLIYSKDSSVFAKTLCDAYE